jgi:hypothetical protein
MAFHSGSYGPTAREPIAIGVWWALGLGAALSLWPLARVPRAALVSAGLLAALGLLSGLSIAWSDSAENAFAEVDRVALYLGVFALVVVVARRGSARRWADGLAVGITAVGLVALASRLLPGVIHGQDLSSFFSGTTYLSYPLQYWNGLAVFVGLAFPLLLRAAVAERAVWRRGIALAPLPALAGTIYLTSSRGGVLTAAVGVALFVALTNRRAAALSALAIAGVGSAAAVVALSDRHELVNGPFGTHLVASQGRSATLLILVICALTGAAYAAGARLSLPVPRLRSRRLRMVLLACLVVVVAGGVVAAHPAKRWQDFIKPPANLAAQQQGGDLGTGSHLSSSASNGRWQFWQAAASEFSHHPLAGGGAGSYAAWWARNGTISYFTRNAHSLYLETLGELGIVGLAIVLGLVASVVPPVRRRLRAAQGEDRATAAALAAVFGAFAFAAGIDWMWQMTVVAVVGIAVLALLTGPATVFAGGASPPPPAPSPPQAWRRRHAPRAALVALALALIVAEAIPFLAQTKIQNSQHDATTGNTAAAVRDARDAQGLEPWAASPYLQSALVREGSGDLRDAQIAIRHAIARAPTDWSLWLVASRIAGEAGDTATARADHAQAQSLDPRSSLFSPAAAGQGTATAVAG